ncbi:uncharacterized protein SPPG_00707 [Spizellomyces punctatus DAOM BR117]|uniref:CUE domain-containing protein n=1 Tax=Spizellomyces punctatus (strain DAOM BR117) TaxID=645134 RepID=A0A0L0HV93_SPIPD|nr:uncharacterized protein SPPG_00707 [Spizellomyces punctatus DAOM BR117]KND05028.1 hypothetical protein SPPG_00707 [Spizellomyces punctatus DAOM BR117]|eukprot:XP_016613067.1 hypothetical protein SPPG_00707 [Spizellomyces punctatus DAOM BR117]
MADSTTVVISVALIILFFRYIVFGGPSQSSSSSNRTTAAPISSTRASPIRHVSPDKVDTVLSMFPAFPRSTIEADLARTGSVEQTCENILTGVLVPPPQPIPSSSTGSSSSSTLSKSTGTPSHAALSTLINDTNAPLSEPPRMWEQTAEAREKSLRARKEYMLRQARQKMLEKQQRSNAVKQE